MKLLPVIQARWAMLHGRERRLLLLAGGVVALAVVWWIGLAPALNILRTAPQRHQTLDGQLEYMRRLQAQAMALQQRPRTDAAEAKRALEESTRQQFGAAGQVQITGAQASVTLKAVPADALALWLSQVRLNAHAAVSQARLQRDGAAQPATWSGTMVLVLAQP